MSKILYYKGPWVGPYEYEFALYCLQKTFPNIRFNSQAIELNTPPSRQFKGVFHKGKMYGKIYSDDKARMCFEPEDIQDESLLIDDDGRRHRVWLQFGLYDISTKELKTLHKLKQNRIIARHTDLDYTAAYDAYLNYVIKLWQKYEADETIEKFML